MEPITTDYHIHTDFSDGSDIREMAEAAVDAGLKTVGSADHCVPYEDRFDRCARYDFDENIISDAKLSMISMQNRI